MGSVDGKVCLVTGTGPNIGLAIARKLAAEGGTIACNDIDPAAAQASADALREAGAEALAVPGDISSADQAQRIVSDVLARYDRVDVLVNNAAVSRPASLLDVTLDKWETSIGVILTGSMLMSQAVARSMVERSIRGSIICVASTSGHVGRANALCYCSAKAGLLNLTRAMAMDLAQHGIRVNSISPTQTGISLTGGTQRSQEAPNIPLGRYGDPAEQAAVVAFLASDAASFITGEDLRVDGGALATWGWGTSAFAAARVPEPVSDGAGRG